MNIEEALSRETQEGDIRCALSGVVKALAGHHEALNARRSRLDEVLRPMPDVKITEATNQGPLVPKVCPLAARLQNVTDEIRGFTAIVDDLLARLQL